MAFNWECEVASRHWTVLLLNTGLWWTKKVRDCFGSPRWLEVFKDTLVSTARMVARHSHPRRRVFYSTTPLPHTNCANHQRPVADYFDEVYDAELDKFQWIHVAFLDGIAASAFRRHVPEVTILNLAAMASLRPDGHARAVGNEDCVHYCRPGPVDGMSGELVRTLHAVRSSEEGQQKG